jgi:REP element-mobilizing transposase RayT
MRIEYPGAVYHVTGRGNARQDVYLCEGDRVCFLDILRQVNHRYNWICHAYCLMDNHYHLLIETPDGNLSSGMRQLGGVYTQNFNRRHGRVGHLFQGRYKSVLVQKESHLLEAVRYVALNPLRAGMVSSVADWPWSSYLATVGMTLPHKCLIVDWVLQQFSVDSAQAQKLYQQFVAEGIGQKSIWNELRGQTLLGQENFAETLGSILSGLNAMTEVPRSERLVNRPLLNELFAEEIEGDKKVRNDKIVEAVDRYGYTQKEIADYLGFHYSTISRLIGNYMSRVKT